MNLPRPTTGLSAAVATTCLVAAGLVTVAATTTSQASTAGDARCHHQCRVLRFGVEFSPENVIDVPPLQTTPGDYRPGDYLTFGDVLVNHAGRHVGAEAGTGMITRVDDTGAQIFYSMAIKLHGGQITAGGIGSPDPHKYLAVTGGTGSFTGAAGSVSVTENGDAANTGTLVIRLR